MTLKKNGYNNNGKKKVVPNKAKKKIGIDDNNTNTSDK